MIVRCCVLEAKLVWQTLVLESFTAKLSSLQHMQAPGALVLESGTSRLHLSQILGQVGRVSTCGGVLW